jgi:hypothetical protein
MKILDPWAPIILQDNFTDIDFNAIINRFKSIKKDIPINAPVEKEGGLSSVVYNRITKDYPHTWKELSVFGEWLDSGILDSALEKWLISGIPYAPTDSWINEHPKGAWTSEHNHRGASFSLAYYLHVPENSGTIMFRDPMEYHWGSSHGAQSRGIDEMWYPVGPVKTGDLVLFPGWLYHKTEENKSDESRFVLSMNFASIRSLPNETNQV